jgi:hypothetical protein
MPFVFAVFFFTYLVALFPLAYFRHDDWMNIANGRLGVENWRNYFEATVRFGNDVQVWFFRPFFKWASYKMFQVFGFRHYSWLLVQFACLLGGLWILGRTLEGISGRRGRAWQFLALVCASWQLHAGSLLWTGEGLMNCPQILLLGLCLWSFWRFEVRGERRFFVLSVLFFVLSLTIKESSVFTVALLGALVWCEPPWQDLGLKDKALRLLPFALVAAVYLVFRLGYLPYNTNYSVVWVLDAWLHSIVMVLGPLVLVVVAWFFIGPRPQGREVLRRFVYLPFLAVSLLPYLGHPFFSPGWLLVPGVFLIFILLLIPRAEAPGKRDSKVIAVYALLMLGIVVARLHQLDWWRWERSQRALVEIGRTLDTAKFDQIDLEVCESPEHPQATWRRVMGSDMHLMEFLTLFHEKPIRVRFISCTYANAQPVERVLRLTWKYPDLIRLD